MFTEFVVLRGIGAAVVIECDIESGEVFFVCGFHLSDEGFFGPSFLSSPDHDCSAVGIISADEDAALTAQFLESDPDVGLDVFDEMAEVDMAIGVGQRGGYQQFLLIHCVAFARLVSDESWR